MGTQSMVYGVIETWSSRTYYGAEIAAANTRVLSELPETDEWPFLIRSMFAETVEPPNGVEYESRIIHFGAAFKEIETEWKEWTDKFESLLHQLKGRSAVVHLESELVGDHKLVWVAIEVAGVWKWEFLSGPKSFDLGNL